MPRHALASIALFAAATVAFFAGTRPVSHDVVVLGSASPYSEAHARAQHRAPDEAQPLPF